jgi:glycosyltransferase involved in cell wall biosynthesis
MKIALITSLEQDVPPKGQNGLEFIVHWLDKELSKRGHEITLFGSDESQSSGIRISLLPKSLWHDGGRAWKQPARSLWNSTYAASRAQEFDIIHSHTGTILFSMPWLTTPVVQTIHHPASEDMWRSEFSTDSVHKQMQFIFDQHAKINYVAVSDAQKRMFDPWTPKIHTIPNGIPTAEFLHASKQYSKKDYLLYIGYINAKKGADTAVQVALATGKKLLLAGNTYGEEIFFAEHIKPYLGEQIEYVGIADFESKIKLYSQAQALLTPLAWDEPYGLTLAEAQACGTPVISYNRGASKEIIKEGITGFVVDSFDQMCQAVLICDRLKQEDCYVHARDALDSSYMIDKYEKLYKSLL